MDAQTFIDAKNADPLGLESPMQAIELSVEMLVDVVQDQVRQIETLLVMNGRLIDEIDRLRGLL